MKDVRINNRINRVFVLKETDERLVYIPIKSLHRVDYERLRKIEAEAGEGNMLDAMVNLNADNGLNSLVMYDSLIQVLVKTTDKGGDRLLKPGEKSPQVTIVQVAQAPQAEAGNNTISSLVLNGTSVETPEKPARRRPGPKPRAKQQ